MFRKGLVILTILVFVGTCIIPAIAQETNKARPSSRGSWLYVGGSGPGNYTSIQDAIDNASEGNTVFVYRGHYNETILINKSIFVNGEERDMTFIENGDDPYTSVRITGANIEFKRFTIQNAGHGIIISGCVGGRIAENYVGRGAYGIMILNSDSVIVSNNTIQQNILGISIENSKNVTITGNIIDGGGEGNAYGIEVTGGVMSITYRTNIKRNTITNYLYGITLANTLFTIVQENNFLKNDKLDSVFSNSFFTVWKQNYWNRSRVLPMAILGVLNPIYIIIFPYFNFDWRPAQEPYDIPGMS